MRILSLIRLCAIVLTTLTTSCSSTEVSNHSNLQAAASPTTSIPSPTPPKAIEAKPSQAPIPQLNSPIRSIDFTHIMYPNLPDDRGYKKRRMTLKPAKAEPTYISYGDVTGDGLEEAMVVLSIENRGSAIPHYVYIFAMEEGRPKLIWGFKTGDRADGGLRQINAENGELVIELFGRDRVIGGELYRGDEGLCCPKVFTRTRFRWTGKQFEQDGNAEIEPNPTGNAAPTMPLYGSSR